MNLRVLREKSGQTLKCENFIDRPDDCTDSETMMRAKGNFRSYVLSLRIMHRGLGDVIFTPCMRTLSDHTPYEHLASEALM